MKAAPDRGGLQMHRSVLGQCAESRQTRVGTNKQSHQRWVDAKKHSRTAEPVSPERCSFGLNYTSSAAELVSASCVGLHEGSFETLRVKSH